MHDGQNLFDPALVFNGTDGDIDGAMTRLIVRGAMHEARVVGAWNSPQRFLEWMPHAPVTTTIITSGIGGVPPFDAVGLQSDV